MSKSPATPLSIPGMPKKGEAAPAVASFEEAVLLPLPRPVAVPDKSAEEEESTPVRLSSRVQATIAVTVRLDEPRYERMKTWGTTRRRVTNQEIIVAALDGFFKLPDSEREEAIARLRKQ